MNVTPDMSMATGAGDASATSAIRSRTRWTVRVHSTPARSKDVTSSSSIAHVIVASAGGSSRADTQTRAVRWRRARRSTDASRSSVIFPPVRHPIAIVGTVRTPATSHARGPAPAKSPARGQSRQAKSVRRVSPGRPIALDGVGKADDPVPVGEDHRLERAVRTDLLEQRLDVAPARRQRDPEMTGDLLGLVTEPQFSPAPRVHAGSVRPHPVAQRRDWCAGSTRVHPGRPATGGSRPS